MIASLVNYRHGQFGNLELPGMAPAVSNIWFKSAIVSTSAVLRKRVYKIKIPKKVKLKNNPKMPSIKEYKERLRLLENHIGSLRKQNDDLRHENESLKNQLVDSEDNLSSTIDKLNKMEELLTQKSKEIAKIQEQAKRQVIIDNESKTIAKDEPVDNFEIELGVEHDCANLDNLINELELKRYELVKVGTSRYKCPIETSCVFQADISKMHEHTRKHTGERPFQCTICNKYFVSKSVTRRHIRGKHLEHLTSVKSESMNLTESETTVLNGFGSCTDKENSSPANQKSPQTRYSLRRSNAKRKILDETSGEINTEKRFKTDI